MTEDGRVDLSTSRDLRSSSSSMAIRLFERGLLVLLLGK